MVPIPCVSTAAVPPPAYQRALAKHSPALHLDALRVVLPDDPPLRMVLQEMLVVLCFGWLDNRDPTHSDLRTLTAALEKAVDAA